MFKKMQKFTQNKQIKKVLGVACALMVACSAFVTTAFAADGADMTAQDAASTIFATITESINVGTIVGVIGIALGAGLGLYFAWWGIRKVSAMVRKGLNGKSPM